MGLFGSKKTQRPDNSGAVRALREDIAINKATESFEEELKKALENPRTRTGNDSLGILLQEYVAFEADPRKCIDGIDKARSNEIYQNFIQQIREAQQARAAEAPRLPRQPVFHFPAPPAVPTAQTAPTQTPADSDDHARQVAARSQVKATGYENESTLNVQATLAEAMRAGLNQSKQHTK